jgi:alcohol dehydrogenase YqhD (iron-dependent ADH family)
MAAPITTVSATVTSPTSGVLRDSGSLAVSAAVSAAGSSAANAAVLMTASKLAVSSFFISDSFSILDPYITS